MSTQTEIAQLRAKLTLLEGQAEIEQLKARIAQLEQQLSYHYIPYIPFGCSCNCCGCTRNCYKAYPSHPYPTITWGNGSYTTSTTLTTTNDSLQKTSTTLRF